MMTASGGLRLRVLSLLVLALPLVAGAVYLGTGPGDRAPRVAVVQEAGSGKPGSASARLVAAVTATPEFDWQVAAPEEVSAAMARGDLLAAVRIPAGFDATARGDSADRTVVVIPGRADLDTATYAALVQSVSAGASRVGVDDLLVSVSRARTNFDVASVTAAGIRSAAEQADVTFTDALASVNQLMDQAGPLMANAQTLLTAIQDNVGVVDQIAGQLDTFAASMRGVDVTLADLRSGLDRSGGALDAASASVTATATARAQLRTILLPITDALRASGIPDAGRMADQLAGLAEFAGGANDEQAVAGMHGLRVGTELLSAQLADLSGLLGVPVAEQSRVADVLTLAVNRLRMVGALLADGERTITEVMGQLVGAQATLPAMQDQIATQLTQFKQVTAQLVVTLDNGVRGLPTRGDPTARTIAESVRLAPPGGHTGDDARRTVIGVLLAALIIAALRAWWCDAAVRSTRARVLTAVAATGAAVATGLVAGLTLDGTGRTTAAFALLVLTALASTALAAALIQLAGRAGIVLMAALIGAAAMVGDSPSNPVRGLLPSSYAVTGLSDTAGGSAVPHAVLFAVCAVSAGCLAVAERRAARRVSGSP